MDEIINPNSYVDPYAYSSINPPYNEAKSANIIKYQLESLPFIKRLINQLKGRVFDAEKQKYITLSTKKLMNDLGINSIVDIYISPKVNKDVYLANLSEKQIRRMIHENLINLNDELFNCNDMYEIEVANIPKITDLVGDAIEIALSRPYMEGERKFLGGMSEIRHTNISGDASVFGQKKGIFGRVR